MFNFLLRHRRRVIGGVIAVAFMTWLLQLSVFHWWETKSGHDFLTFASLSTLAELMVVGLGSVFVRVTRSGALAGALVIAAAIVFEGFALFQPMTGLAESLTPASAFVHDERGAEIDAALASGDAYRIQVAIGAVDPSLLTDSVSDGQLGPDTIRAAAIAKREIGRSQGAAHTLWLIFPLVLTALALVVSLSLGHFAFGPEKVAKPKAAAQEPRIRWTALDFAEGRVPARPGRVRVGIAPCDRYPEGRVRFDQGSEDEASYLARVARMRHVLGLDVRRHLRAVS